MFKNLKIIYKLTDSLTKPRPINGYSCKQLPVFRKIKCRFCQAYEIASARRVRLGVLLTNIIILISFLNIQTQGHALSTLLHRSYLI